MRFEYYLSTENSNFIVGNSSSGIMEAPYYGVTISWFKAKKGKN